MPARKAVMSGIDGIRSGKTSPLRSRPCHQEEQVSETPAKSGDLVVTCMSGSSGGSLTIQCDKQARALPKRKGGGRRVRSLTRGNQPA